MRRRREGVIPRETVGLGVWETHVHIQIPHLCNQGVSQDFFRSQVPRA